MQPLEQSFLRNPNKPVTEDILAISKAMGFTAPRPVANMLDSVEPVDTKPLDKVIRIAHMEVTKALEATTMVAIASSVADGEATTDINWPREVAARPWSIVAPLGWIFLTKTVLLLPSTCFIFLLLISCTVWIKWMPQERKIFETGHSSLHTEQAEAPAAIRFSFSSRHLLVLPWFIPTLFSISFLISHHRNQSRRKKKHLVELFSVCRKERVDFVSV